MVIRIDCLRKLLNKILNITLFLEDCLAFLFLLYIYLWNVFMEFSNDYGKVKSSLPGLFCKRSVLENLTKFTCKKHLGCSLFIKKETPTKVFFCEFCKILKNTFLDRSSLVVASVKFVADCSIRRTRSQPGDV